MSDQNFYNPAPLENDLIDDEVDTEEEALVEPDEEPDEDTDAGADADAGVGATRPKAGGLTRATAKKVIEKYLELVAAPQNQLQLLAATLGVKADPADLAATIVSAQRTNLQAINELASIAEAASASPFAAVLEAATLSRENAKKVWVVLTHLGQVSGVLPVKELTAAAKIAEAAAELNGGNLSDLDAVRQLGHK